MALPRPGYDKAPRSRERLVDALVAYLDGRLEKEFDQATYELRMVIWMSTEEELSAADLRIHWVFMGLNERRAEIAPRRFTRKAPRPQKALPPKRRSAKRDRNLFFS